MSGPVSRPASGAGAGPGAGPGEPVVDVRDAFCLHALPEGAVAALRGLTLTVAAGERVVVHGPNGSGKTTLLRVLAGEQRLSAGRALVAGADVGGGGGTAGWRVRHLGWVDQHPLRTLRPELDVVDNVALQQRLAGTGARQAREVALAVLDRLGVAALADRPLAALSGGEAQRVAVAAALAHGPRLVLADEPSGELDARSAEQVYDALAEAVTRAGAALVLVSHDRRAGRIADRVVRIRDGRLSETWRPGGPEELVVDDRGWVRLPDAFRPRGETSLALSAVPDDGALVLRPAGGAVGAARDHPVATVEGMLPGARPAPGAAPVAAPVAARAAGVTKAFGERTVLAGVDLQVRASRLVVVRGRSGAGKSTLLRVLVGLEDADAGCVELDGVEVGPLDRAGRADLRRRCTAVVGQDVQLGETSDAVGNLEFARALRGLPPDPALVAARLHALALEPVQHRAVRLLSGGERQRVAVARALAVGARLLVLDEPTSQLDEASAEVLAAVLSAAAREGVAVLVATHDPVLVAAADAVVDLEAPTPAPARVGAS